MAPRILDPNPGSLPTNLSTLPTYPPNEPLIWILDNPSMALCVQIPQVLVVKGHDVLQGIFHPWVGIGPPTSFGWHGSNRSWPSSVLRPDSRRTGNSCAYFKLVPTHFYEDCPKVPIMPGEGWSGTFSFINASIRLPCRLVKTVCFHLSTA